MQDKKISLPLELWRVILSHLQIVDLCHCCQVSKAWQELIQSLDNTRWKELYLFKNPWKHPNWPNRPKEDPESWQQAYKERYLAAKKWLKFGADAKCTFSLWRLLKKPNQKVLHVGHGPIYSRLKDAIAVSSAFDIIYIHDEIKEEQSPIVIKHPIEIIGKASEGKVRINAIEIQCPTARISNVVIRSSSHRAQNPLSTILKVTNGCLYLDNSTVENGHVQVTSPSYIDVSYCSFKNASIQLRTYSQCKIAHCEFQGGEHSAILVEGTQSLGKQRFIGLHLAEWMSRHDYKTVEELYSNVVMHNTQRPIRVYNNENCESHLLVKDLKKKASLTGDPMVDIPPEMSQTLSQRSSLSLGSTPYNLLRNSTGCVIHNCHFFSRRGAIMIRHQGNAWIECNEISNVTYGIRCIGNSKVTVLANFIHNCSTSGLFFRDRSGGLVAGNVILRNGEAGIDIRNASDPYVQHNQILNGKRSGVVVLDGGHGTLTDNDIYDNKEAGVYILYRGNPVVRCNRIWDGEAAGIAVTEHGFGYISFNDICGMEWGGIDIRNGGHPIILNNTIHRGHGDGVVIRKNGCGLIFENVIKDNCGCGVWVLSTSRPVIFGNHISNCCDHGVAFVSTVDDLRENQKLSAQFPQQDQDQDPVARLHVFDEEPSSASFFDDNDMESVEYLSPHLEKNTPIVDNNTICDNNGCGLSFAGTEGVIIRGNSLTGNYSSGISIEMPGDVIITSNSVANNKGLGVFLDVGTFACLRDNSICGNHGNGIVAHGRGQIKENDVIGNLARGIEVRGPGDPFVVKNRIFSSDYNAVEIFENARGCVNHNEIFSGSGENIVEDPRSMTLVEDNVILTSLVLGESTSNQNTPVDLSDLSFLKLPSARPCLTGNAIPRPDISHIVGKLTVSDGVKTTTSSCRNMSRFCVIL